MVLEDGLAAGTEEEDIARATMRGVDARSDERRDDSMVLR